MTDAALDLRPAELAVLVPLVACLLALSAWPAAVSDRAFAGDAAGRDVATQFREAAPAGTALRLYVIVPREGGEVQRRYRFESGAWTSYGPGTSP